MSHYEGPIVDLDGVLTKTASLHFRAWQETFEEFLEERPEASGNDSATSRLPRTK